MTGSIPVKRSPKRLRFSHKVAECFSSPHLTITPAVLHYNKNGLHLKDLQSKALSIRAYRIV